MDPSKGVGWNFVADALSGSHWMERAFSAEDRVVMDVIDTAVVIVGGTSGLARTDG